MTPSAEYRSDIDGLRALAVIAVILFHFKVGVVPGGFMGVDVFFVISGFLIIRIILRELAAGTFSLGDFWMRRVRRIIPALLVVLFATTIAAYFVILLPIDLVNFGKTLIAQSLFLSNLWFMGESTYFAAPAETMPLLHTWTLALEEQFYILFPLVALLFYRHARGAQRWFKYLMIALALLSFWYSLVLLFGQPQERFAIQFLPHFWGSANNATAAFYFLIPRLWEFLVGGLIAVFTIAIERKLVAEMLSLAGLAAIVGGLLGSFADTAFPGLIVLLPVIGTAAVIVANTTHQTFVKTALSYPAMVGTGIISYSLYLWHWPLLVLAHYQLYSTESLGQTDKLLLLGATFVLAYLTYRFVELPIRERQFLAKPKQLALAAVLGLVTMGLIGFTFVRTEGFPERVTEKGLLVATAMEDTNPRRDECFTKTTVAPGAEPSPCLLGLPNPDAIDFVLWGDSHANSAMPAFEAYGIATNQTGIFFGVGSCTPIPSMPPLTEDPECIKELRRAMDFIQSHKPKEVFLVAEWRDGYKFAGTDEGWYLYALLSNTIDIMPAETLVTVMHQLPTYQNYNFRDLFLQNVREGKELQLSVPRSEFEASHKPFYEQIERGVAGHTNARTLDPADTVCDTSLCYLGTEAGLYNSDSSHLSNYGAREIILPLLLSNTTVE